jgi:hypothetical protein
MKDDNSEAGDLEQRTSSRMHEQVAFLAAFAFGGITTAGLVLQRLDNGARGGLWLGAASMACAVYVYTATRSALETMNGSLLWTRIHSRHVLGATSGILAVHGLLAVRLLRDPVLVECPAQLVNDAVLVGCVLELVWAVVARSWRARLVWFVVALASCFAYLRTEVFWHCDSLAGHPVQDYIAAQLAAAFDAAVALLVTTGGRAT